MTTSPRDDVRDPDIALDLTSLLAEEDFHMRDDQLNRERWTEESSKKLFGKVCFLHPA